MSNDRVWNGSEINLSLFVKQLYEKKVVLILFTFAFFILGVGISTLKPVKWSSNIKITDISSFEYTENLSNFNTLMVYLDNNERNILEKSVSPDALLNKFIRRYNSFEIKKEFYELKFKNRTDEELKDFVFNNIYLKKNKDSVLLTFSDVGSKENVVQLSHDYFNFINDNITTSLEELYNSVYNNAINVSELNLKLIKRNIDKYMEGEKTKLQIASKMAESADLKLPLTNMAENTPYPYELGTSILNENLKILNLDKGEFYNTNSNYNTIQAKIEGLKELKLNKKLDLNIVDKEFSFKNNITSDKKIKIYIVLISTIFGFLLASCLITVFFHIKKNKG
ncbi:Wzz/FepE/Etk N-terminal domain-containing protein [Photobacterium angustum]|uniref:Wzz/FepE/Etk N-terminal domain-containing protein n=1 Tax=Photobacterium angustum TaxID=661 RepID=UPI003D0971EA